MKNTFSIRTPATWLQQADVILCVILFGFALYTFYPGFISPDSITQFRQAQSHLWNDHHPPFMAFVWFLVNKIFPGPFGMLFLHNLFFFSGLSLFVRALRLSSIYRLLLVIAMAGMPAIIAQLGIVWKDVGLSTSYFLACAFLLNAQDHRPFLWAAMLPLFYGTAVRHNAAIALLPIALWVGILYQGHLDRRAFFIGGLVILAICGGVKVVDSWLIGPRKTYPFQALEFQDLAAISLVTGHLVIPPRFLLPGMTLARLASCYVPFDNTPIFVLAANPAYTAAEAHTLFLIWCKEIGTHFSICLGHHYYVFQALMGLYPGRLLYAPFICRIDPNPWGWSIKAPWSYRWLYGILIPLQNTLLFRGYAYFLLDLLLLVSAIRWRTSWSVVCLASSGFLYTLAFFALPTSAEFRYLYWPALSGVMALVLFLKESSGPSLREFKVNRISPFRHPLNGDAK